MDLGKSWDILSSKEEPLRLLGGFYRLMQADGWLVEQASEQMWEPTQGGAAHLGG